VGPQGTLSFIQSYFTSHTVYAELLQSAKLLQHRPEWTRRYKLKRYDNTTKVLVFAGKVMFLKSRMSYHVVL